MVIEYMMRVGEFGANIVRICPITSIVTLAVANIIVWGFVIRKICQTKAKK